jgi:hypothetical protein
MEEGGKGGGREEKEKGEGGVRDRRGETEMWRGWVGDGRVVIEA